MVDRVSSVRIDPAIAAEIMRAFRPQLSAACLVHARRVAEMVRADAPRSNDPGPHFADTIVAEADPGGGARAISHSPLAHLIEFGSPGHQAWGHPGTPLPAQWLFRRAGERSGLPWLRAHGRGR